MARGSRTPLETELEFRKHYLVTGNAAGSARAVGLPIGTGYDLADRANADPEFLEARNAIHARVGPDAERMMFAAIQVAMERLNKEPPSPEELAKMGAQRIQVQDSGPHYLRGIVAAYDAITKSKKLEAQLAGDMPAETEVTINVRPTAQAESRTDGGASSSPIPDSVPVAREGDA